MSDEFDKEFWELLQTHFGNNWKHEWEPNLVGGFTLELTTWSDAGLDKLKESKNEI